MKKITRYCKRCGKPFYGHKSKVYCSAKCRRTHPRPSWNKGLIGLPANHKKNGIVKSCRNCGKEFYVPKSAMKQLYCSAKCYYKDRWKDARGKVKTACIVCGAPIYDFASNNKTVCSKKCRYEHVAYLLSGEQSHFWRGGKTAPYHKEWRKSRRKALERDNYKCSQCGSENDLVVHHIIPYRYSQDHSLDNLATLCRTCHGSEEYRVNANVRKELAVGRTHHAKICPSYQK